MPLNLFQIMRGIDYANAHPEELPQPFARHRIVKYEKHGKLTKEECDKAAQMYAAGEPLSAITKTLHRHYYAVRQALVERGIRIRPIGRRSL